MEWALGIFHELMQLDDSRKILNIYMYCDQGNDFMQTWNERRTRHPRDLYGQLHVYTEAPDLAKLMTQESNLDAGNMAISGKLSLNVEEHSLT